MRTLSATETGRPRSCPGFAGKSKIQQHQMVYGALGGRMGGVLHALKLTTMAQKP